MFWVNWRFRRTCSSSCVTSLIEISKAGVLKDDTFHDKGASVFVDCDGHTLFVFSPRALLLVLVDEMNDVFQFADGEYFLCRFQVRVRNQVTVLSKEVVDQNLFLSLVNMPSPSCEI